MRNNRFIFEIVITGILCSIAIVIGGFASFPLFGTDRVYLAASVLFLFPILVRMYLAITGTIISVVLIDLLTGWIANTWISIIAYSFAILIIIFFISKYQERVELFFVSTIIASFALIIIYFLGEFALWGKGLAIDNLFTNFIQSAICIGITWLIYPVIKKIRPMGDNYL